MHNKILFCLKRREDYNGILHSSIGVSTGLYNSATLVSNMLNTNGIESKVVVLTDNNDIDREVTQYNPTVVIIEALWVVPEKFDILQKLHPNRKWIIRLHSETSFLANEGMAYDWLGRYMQYENVFIGVNSPRMINEVKQFLGIVVSDVDINEKVIYMPNYYNVDFKSKSIDRKKAWIDIGCFGAIRPLKNQLLQALVAIQFAEAKNKKLRFHINSGRIELNGSPIMHNIKHVFEHVSSRGHELIIHQWMPHEEFLEVVGSMDINMQVSFTETFNIVTADSLDQGVPIVCSDEVPFAASAFVANPVDSEDILGKLQLTWSLPYMNVSLNQMGLRNYSNKTERIWNKLFGHNGNF